MRRSGFRRPLFERPPRVAHKLTRPATAALVDHVARPVSKPEPVRSEAYRRLVAALPCIRCGIAGYSQAAHPNTGKGAGSKTDDRLCFPLCAPRLGEPGCHSRFDQGALYTKGVRRAIEVEWSKETQRKITEAGAWPPGLPPYNWQA